MSYVMVRSRWDLQVSLDSMDAVEDELQRMLQEDEAHNAEPSCCSPQNRSFVIL